MRRAPTSVEIFLSYAQADEPLRAELEKHLAGLRRERIIEAWHDRKILAGADRAREIDARLSSSDVILLLVSPDFIGSDYCYDVEVKEAMRRYEAGAARVIPVLLRAVDWQAAPFARIQPLPKSGRPTCSAADRDEAFAEALHGRGAGLDEAESIRALLLGLTEAVATADVPTELQKITIVEKDEHAVPRIRDVIDDHWSDEAAARRILVPWAYELSIP
ncbi:toll/interleukin-1 receptor domain-containing protein [Sorangium sp. So ce1078]|uniref:toll/interleukin-1 receptor domain-containing protein n=1 Tax=Sorangium sp. So ce1078 TaxID=3133329 RepID=UPI003F5E3BA7